MKPVAMALSFRPRIALGVLFLGSMAFAQGTASLPVGCFSHLNTADYERLAKAQESLEKLSKDMSLTEVERGEAFLDIAEQLENLDAQASMAWALQKAQEKAQELQSELNPVQRALERLSVAAARGSDLLANIFQQKKVRSDLEESARGLVQAEEQVLVRLKNKGYSATVLTSVHASFVELNENAKKMVLGKLQLSQKRLTQLFVATEIAIIGGGTLGILSRLYPALAPVFVKAVTRGAVVSGVVAVSDTAMKTYFEGGNVFCNLAQVIVNENPVGLVTLALGGSIFAGALSSSLPLVQRSGWALMAVLMGSGVIDGVLRVAGNYSYERKLEHERKSSSPEISEYRKKQESAVQLDSLRSLMMMGIQGRGMGLWSSGVRASQGAWGQGAERYQDSP